MARRTKEDARATREALIDAAEHLFQAHGVARTSLAQIATQAGTTRGAIYWHFKDKADLFNAMMERVTLPLGQALQAADLASDDPAQALRAAVLDAFARIESDPQLVRVLQIATHRVELTAELAAVQQRRVNKQQASLHTIAAGLLSAYALRKRAPSLPLDTAALGLQALLEGLLAQWLLTPGRFALITTVAGALDIYLHGLGLRSFPGTCDRSIHPLCPTRVS